MMLKKIIGIVWSASFFIPSLFAMQSTSNDVNTSQKITLIDEMARYCSMRKESVAGNHLWEILIEQDTSSMAYLIALEDLRNNITTIKELSEIVDNARPIPTTVERNKAEKIINDFLHRNFPSDVFPKLSPNVFALLEKSEDRRLLEYSSDILKQHIDTIIPDCDNRHIIKFRLVLEHKIKALLSKKEPICAKAKIKRSSPVDYSRDVLQDLEAVQRKMVASRVESAHPIVSDESHASDFVDTCLLGNEYKQKSRAYLESLHLEQQYRQIFQQRSSSEKAIERILPIVEDVGVSEARTMLNHTLLELEACLKEQDETLSNVVSELMECKKTMSSLDYIHDLEKKLLSKKDERMRCLTENENQKHDLEVRITKTRLLLEKFDSLLQDTKTMQSELVNEKNLLEEKEKKIKEGYERVNKFLKAIMQQNFTVKLAEGAFDPRLYQANS